MALTAIIVSVLTLAMAVASAHYSRQQAQTARQVAALDAERRLKERRPTITACIEARSAGHHLGRLCGR